LIGALYGVERKANTVDESGRMAERHRLRQAESRPILELIWAWAASQRALPQSGLGKAIAYMLALKPSLSAFLDDPAIPLDNNRAEQALRSVVLGRKNHLGSKSQRGTEVAALFYTLCQSAMLSGVNPREYLVAAAKQALQDPERVLLPAEFRRQQELAKAP
jgi:hypothetical protein